MEISQSLKTHLKRLKLSGVLATLPDRIAYARKTKLPELELLELVLQDEVDRRDHQNLAIRLARAGFEEEQTLESFDWNAPVSFDRDRVKDLFGLGFLERHEDVIFLGPGRPAPHSSQSAPLEDLISLPPAARTRGAADPSA
jgi:hypothetical protein